MTADITHDLNILSRVFDPTLTLEPESSRAKVGPEAEGFRPGSTLAQEEPEPAHVEGSPYSGSSPFHSAPGFSRTAPGQEVVPGAHGRPDDPGGILAAQLIH